LTLHSRLLMGSRGREQELAGAYLRLPDPLPIGRSGLDRLDRASLLKLWEESERETSRIMHEIRDRNEEECRSYLHHGHFPEQGYNNP
jgi:hypothetical protein